MSDYIYPEHSMNDRIKMLQNLSVKSEVKTYNRSLSEEEISREKDRYSSDAIEVDRQKKDLKATVDRLKAGITSVETLMEERLERIKTGQMETTATLYGVPDHNKGFMNWYDNYGERINSTALTPDEKQGRLFIGDDPLGKPRPYTETDDNGITDVEFEEAPAEGSVTLDEAVDKMYAEEAGNIEIEVKAPEEDKPAKKAGKAKKGKSPAKEDDEQVF